MKICNFALYLAPQECQRHHTETDQFQIPKGKPTSNVYLAKIYIPHTPNPLHTQACRDLLLNECGIVQEYVLFHVVHYKNAFKNYFQDVYNLLANHYQSQPGILKNCSALTVKGNHYLGTGEKHDQANADEMILANHSTSKLRWSGRTSACKPLQKLQPRASLLITKTPLCEKYSAVL